MFCIQEEMMDCVVASSGNVQPSLLAWVVHAEQVEAPSRFGVS